MKTEQQQVIEAVITDWMAQLIRGNRLGYSDDLHVDEIHPDYERRENWVDAICSCLHVAEAVAQRLAPRATVTIGASLTACPNRTDLAPESLEALVGQVDWTPPSIYLFPAGREPWVSDENRGTSTLLRHAPSTYTLHVCVWDDALEGEHRRSAWLSRCTSGLTRV